MREFDLNRPAGGRLHAYDTGPTGRPDELAIFWHGGTPNTGLPPAPLFAAAEELGIRFLGADRPGYGGTTRDAAAGVGDVVADVVAVADAVGVDRFGVFGHSGGGPRSLACAALLGGRVVAAVAVSSPAPVPSPGLERFDGMAPGIVAEQQAVAAGREALDRILEADEFDETAFTAGDFEALDGDWAWFGPVVRAATASGPAGRADDLLAAARPWGFELAAIRVPVLLLHGTGDRMVPASHARWLAARIPGATLRPVGGAGHIDVLTAAPEALRWLREQVSPAA